MFTYSIPHLGLYRTVRLTKVASDIPNGISVTWCDAKSGCNIRIVDVQQDAYSEYWGRATAPKYPTGVCTGWIKMSDIVPLAGGGSQPVPTSEPDPPYQASSEAWIANIIVFGMIGVVGYMFMGGQFGMKGKGL